MAMISKVNKCIPPTKPVYAHIEKRFKDYIILQSTVKTSTMIMVPLFQHKLCSQIIFSYNFQKRVILQAK